MIDVHSERIRQRQIHDKLRSLRSSALLPVDVLYARGELDEAGWNVLHLFREDRLAYTTARRHGRVRPSRLAVV